MIDITRLKFDMALIGEHIKRLKRELRSSGKNPTLEQAVNLGRHKDVATKLYVLRASLRNRHHLRTRPCSWHNSIIQELTPKYSEH